LTPFSHSLSAILCATTDFEFKLFEKLAERNPGENLLISPTSIAIALEMTYNGARDETQEVMVEALELQRISLQELNQGNVALMSALENLNDDVQLSLLSTPLQILLNRINTGFYYLTSPTFD